MSATETPVVIYAAKSSPDPKDSTGSQVAQVRERVQQVGDRFEFAPPFTEENVSGYRGSRGPQLEAAIGAAGRAVAEHGQAELWVFHASRLARGSGFGPKAPRSVQEVLTRLWRLGVEVRSVEDDPFVTNRMLVGVASEMAHKYSADLAAHVRRGKEAQLERGERLGGPVPDGYGHRVIRDERDRVTVREYFIDPEREPVIRRIFDLALAGHGAPAIARTLNRESHRTQNGKPWTRRRVQHTLKSPFYAGLAAQLGEMVGQEYRRLPEPRLTPGTWPAYVTRDEWDRIQAGMATRDRAASGRKPEGQRTTRYALARLAVCDRCGARMYARTAPYKRKDGSQQRSYLCGNAKDATGLCDAPKVDAVKIDAAVVEHLNRLFIDFEAWLEELSRGASAQRDALEAQSTALLDELAKINKREERSREKYFAHMDANDPQEAAAFELYQHVLREREGLQKQLQEVQTALAAEPEQPATDQMLDVYNDLARAVRSGAGEGVGQLNDRLRAVFAEFRLDEVAPGVVGVLPILRPDVIERYGDVLPVMVGPGDVKAAPELPPTTPVVVWATDEPVELDLPDYPAWDPPAEPAVARGEATAGQPIARVPHAQA